MEIITMQGLQELLKMKELPANWEELVDYLAGYKKRKFIENRKEYSILVKELNEIERVKKILRRRA